MAEQQGTVTEGVTQGTHPVITQLQQTLPQTSALRESVQPPSPSKVPQQRRFTFAQPSLTRSAISQPAEKPLIGTAVPAELFLLIEAPLPWSKPALLSTGVPDAVRQALKPHLGKYSGLRVHLVANEQTASSPTRRLLVFQRQQDNPQQYSCWEMMTDFPEQMATAITAQLSQPPHHRVIQSSAVEQSGKSGQWVQRDERHLLICTHGSHNECCGIQGYPLYREAIALVESLNLSQTCIWQVSHIGGHRYAPTLIDLPQGRYYGKLTQTTLQSLLQQQGDLAALMNCYRGWSLLPKPLQGEEKLRFIETGWPWLKQGSWQEF